MYRFQQAAALLLVAALAACSRTSPASIASQGTVPVPASVHSPIHKPLDRLGGVDRIDVTASAGQTAAVQSSSTRGAAGNVTA